MGAMSSREHERSRHAACSVRCMNTVLERPSTDPERSPEDMLSDLESLNDAVTLKLETAIPEVQQRYEDELVPLLEKARTFVAQQNIRARNVIEDAVVRFRELLASSTQIDPSAASALPGTSARLGR